MKTLGTHNYFVYILTNKNRKVLYTGVTNNLRERLFWHIYSEEVSNHFAAKYKCFYLIYFEQFNDVKVAISREKQIKGWTRKKKEDLISSFNSSWNFLNDEI